MPLSRTYRRSLKPSRKFRLHKPAMPAPYNPLRTNWLMTLVIVGVTLWSCADGNQGAAMMVLASVASVAAVNVLALIGTLLPRTRLSTAVNSALWVLLFMPAWDWLAGQFDYPGSIYTALAFAGGFGLVRFFTLSGPSRPPW
jgi:hypothetical protein